MTIHKALQIYLDWKQSHTISAYQRYEIRIAKFSKFIGEQTKLQDIKEDDVIQFHQQMDASYSPATIAYSARILKNFFWFWKGRGYKNLNPEEIIPIKFINAEKDIVTKEDMEDMNTVLDERYDGDLQRKLVLNLLWDTGIRISELLDIKISDLQEEGKNRLRTAKVRTRKTMRYNLIAWGSKTNDLLNQYLGLRICMEDVASDNLFINKKTKATFTPKSIQRWVKETRQLAGIDKNITPHSFRHGKANEILEQGGTVRDVSAILRHVSPNSSFNYLQLSQSRYLQTASKFLQLA